MKMRHDYDVIIVGGSVAGAAAAIWLGRAGFRVLVLDRAVFPRDKACGEGIMPSGVSILKEMGLLAPLRQQGARPFYGISFSDPHGCSTTGTFPDPTEQLGLTIRRWHLDAFLLEQAASLPGVDVRQGFRVTHLLKQQGRVCGVRGGSVREGPPSQQTLTARLFLGADGRQSIFHRLPRLRVQRPRRQRFGLRAHLTPVEGLGPRVEVITHRQGEVYIAAQGQDTALVALLLERPAMENFGSDLETGYWETLLAIRPLAERIERSQLISPVMATGPLGSHVTPCYGDGFLLVGDSAGALDPIIGEGMALALKSAKLAAEVILEAFQVSDLRAARLAGYGEKRMAIVRPLARLTDRLLFLSRHSPIAHWAITWLDSHPWALQKLLAAAAGLPSASGR